MVGGVAVVVVVAVVDDACNDVGVVDNDDDNECNTCSSCRLHKHPFLTNTLSVSDIRGITQSVGSTPCATQRVMLLQKAKKGQVTT